MIVDLSELNDDIHKKHFKMQHLEVAIDYANQKQLFDIHWSKGCLLFGASAKAFH